MERHWFSTRGGRQNEPACKAYSFHLLVVSHVVTMESCPEEKILRAGGWADAAWTHVRRNPSSKIEKAQSHMANFLRMAARTAIATMQPGFTSFLVHVSVASAHLRLFDFFVTIDILKRNWPGPLNAVTLWWTTGSRKKEAHFVGQSQTLSSILARIALRDEAVKQLPN